MLQTMPQWQFKVALEQYGVKNPPICTKPCEGRRITICPQHTILIPHTKPLEKKTKANLLRNYLLEGHMYM